MNTDTHTHTHSTKKSSLVSQLGIKPDIMKP